MRQIVEDSPRRANGLAAVAFRVENQAEPRREFREPAVEPGLGGTVGIPGKQDARRSVDESRAFDASLECGQIEMTQPPEGRDGGIIGSQRRPALTVRREVARQESCTYAPT